MLPKAAAGATRGAVLAHLKHGSHRTSCCRCWEVPVPLPVGVFVFYVCLCKIANVFSLENDLYTDMRTSGNSSNPSLS